MPGRGTSTDQTTSTASIPLTAGATDTLKITDSATAVLIPGPQQRAAKEFADRLGLRRREAGAPVRTVFVADETKTGGHRPAMAELLNGYAGSGGGRGGQLRVKLYVSLLWICAKEPYTVNRPARAWAALLGLEPDEKGVRRIQQTFRELRDRNMIEIEERGGHPSIITVLSEEGDGQPYQPAPDAYSYWQSRKNTSPTALARHRYFRVPSALWTRGHISRLNGPGMAMLLVLLAEARGQDTSVWFSPDRAKARFGLSPSTRRQGLDQLRALDLITTKSIVVGEDGAYIDWARRRNAHQVAKL